MARQKQQPVKDASQPLTHEEDPILTLTEAATLVGKSRQSVRRLCKDGWIKYMRVPGTVNFFGVRRSQVLGFLTKCEKQQNGDTTST